MIAAFDERINSIDFDNAKEDVIGYLYDSYEVNAWSKELFHEEIRKIRIKGEGK